MKDSEKIIWDDTRSPVSATLITTQSRSSPSPKLMVWLILFVSLTYAIYTIKLVSTSTTCNHAPFSTKRLSSSLPIIINNATATRHTQTELRHVVFGIAASSKLWEHRKNYIKLWYKPKEMRGVVWLDDRVKTHRKEGLPPVKISTDTSNFAYTNKQGHRSAIRISRIVSETLRLGMKDVRWFVMGDDDTVFVMENLLRILRKYDHKQLYYIGSLSESHLQNIFFSYGMAYGGGGFAISYPLAKALQKMQDRCIQRYPGLYGSDDRMQACMAELGVPLTKEIGFHQVTPSLPHSNYYCILLFIFIITASRSHSHCDMLLFVSPVGPCGFALFHALTVVNEWLEK